MDNIENISINNNVKLKDLRNNYTWIHGKSKDNILITIFLITIEGEQLKYSLEAINKLNTDIPVLVNVIMNVCPTNKAYNEMRMRCKTEFFVQNDEDMELHENAIQMMYDSFKKRDPSVFLNTFKLIDDVIGIGNPPIIDCLKLYNNKIMRHFPTFENGTADVSSVDSLWHKPILEKKYKINDTRQIIGFHGKHRTNFDLLLRYCKILKSIVDPRIKTNSGHLCKLLKALSNGPGDTKTYLDYVIYVFKKGNAINLKVLNDTIGKINAYVSDGHLDMYNIKHRCVLDTYKNINAIKFKSKMNVENSNKLYACVAILCIVTNNYGYSKDKYPYNYYNYFEKK